ncbi:unnamed protein product [Onchocerca flexuosa]|uniref:N-formylglutamate amidohydrolase n=1 Tax=Onchocerca flexuosa TaxID=387005 RepID=A0A183H2D6_9BILA|nr:unnamed protein product [Onchocerca flexuosa]
MMPYLPISGIFANNTCASRLRGVIARLCGRGWKGAVEGKEVLILCLHVGQNDRWPREAFFMKAFLPLLQ